MSPSGEVFNPVCSSRHNKASSVPRSAQPSRGQCHLMMVVLVLPKQQAQSFMILAAEAHSVNKSQEIQPIFFFFLRFKCL